LNVIWWFFGEFQVEIWLNLAYISIIFIDFWRKMVLKWPIIEQL